jgi:hypothetical protein
MVGADADPSLTADEAGQLAMLQTVLVGVGAGAAAALLFASVASGSALSLPLAHLAPLPILIVALGWSHLAGFIAALCAATALATALGFRTSLGFAVGTGAPAWWLGYLALLARPVGNGAKERLEWYPAGRLLLWCAFLGSATAVISFVATFGADWQTFKAEVRKIAEEVARLQAQAARNPDAAGRLERTEVIDALAVALPSAVAAAATVINAFTLWLAGRIVQVSGRLSRPWPDLPDMRLPPLVPVLFAIFVACAWLPEFMGLIAATLATSLAIVYAIVGLAVLHMVTRNTPNRMLILIAVYVSIVPLAGLPLVLISLLGLADSVFQIRSRFVSGQPPPGSPV